MSVQACGCPVLDRRSHDTVEGKLLPSEWHTVGSFTALNQWIG